LQRPKARLLRPQRDGNGSSFTVPVSSFDLDHTPDKKLLVDASERGFLLVAFSGLQLPLMVDYHHRYARFPEGCDVVVVEAPINIVLLMYTPADLWY
jgi:hydroxyacyl-ACP dehydratase HTD2-like protein with hotdog domain